MDTEPQRYELQALQWLLHNRRLLQAHKEQYAAAAGVSERAHRQPPSSVALAASAAWQPAGASGAAPHTIRSGLGNTAALHHLQPAPSNSPAVVPVEQTGGVAGWLEGWKRLAEQRGCPDGSAAEDSCFGVDPLPMHPRARSASMPLPQQQRQAVVECAAVAPPPLAGTIRQAVAAPPPLAAASPFGHGAAEQGCPKAALACMQQQVVCAPPGSSSTEAGGASPSIFSSATQGGMCEEDLLSSRSLLSSRPAAALADLPGPPVGWADAGSAVHLQGTQSMLSPAQHAQQRRCSLGCKRKSEDVVHGTDALPAGWGMHAEKHRRSRDASRPPPPPTADYTRSSFLHASCPTLPAVVPEAPVPAPAPAPAASWQHRRQEVLARRPAAHAADASSGAAGRRAQRSEQLAQCFEAMLAVEHLGEAASAEPAELAFGDADLAAAAEVAAAGTYAYAEDGPQLSAPPSLGLGPSWGDLF
ncbi:hypothetical protein ABPG75_009615 [Micractinium tetrahymenae]